MGSPFNIVHQKLKRLKRVLIQQSRDTYGNFFRKIATLEDIARVKEAQLEINPTKENRKDLYNTKEALRHITKLMRNTGHRRRECIGLTMGIRTRNFFIPMLEIEK